MQISNLHFITDRPDHAEQACRGGVRWVQLRVKNTPAATWRQLALDTQVVCRAYGATLIINDNPHLALEIGADGVHLGKQDMAPIDARILLGPDKIIGGTANTFADIEQHAKAGVDYLGVGPFRFTTTKENLSPILGLAGYAALVEQCQGAGLTIPIIGIGGITLADVTTLQVIGLDGIAVSGAIAQAPDLTRAAAEFVDHLQEQAR
ncbi:thiamine phosphate synthase [Hymenobacter cellulosivorans]|uniref:Thiamine-phosphate synthase n=1 Tax=Hymenobacter cellulosivorans TaxID=2932249 RepID=A0ABY4FAW3_9BACT|nr:thiamine phosphate synthase [Hymenobacter cellulosivorans]UOQ53799.1 thiamine phosphate synthase [Hymenobacter cellulosivorans]